MTDVPHRTKQSRKICKLQLTNNMAKGLKVNSLIGLATLMLFLSSYIPLFGIIALRQIISNFDYLNWAGFSCSGIMLFVTHFGIASLCMVFIIVGSIGTYFVFELIKSDAPNGNNSKIIEVTSMNDEALGYLATYVIPLLYQDYSNLMDFCTMIVIFVIIYKLYVNSKLLLVNPMISFKYSIYSIKYHDGDIQRQAMLISPDKNILENDTVKLYNIGYQLFYGYNR